MGQSGLFWFIFVLFLNTLTIRYSTTFDYIKAKMVCLGFEPGTEGSWHSRIHGPQTKLVLP